jgi:hypothetical protein
MSIAGNTAGLHLDSLGAWLGRKVRERKKDRRKGRKEWGRREEGTEEE